MDESSASACLPNAEPTAPSPQPGVGEEVLDPLDPVVSMPSRARCIWCGAAVTYESDTQAREIWGYCSLECKEDFLGELNVDVEKAFNWSRRNKRKPKKVPAFLRELRGTKADRPAASEGIDLADDAVELE